MNGPHSTVVQFRTTSSALVKQELHDARLAARRRVLKAGLVAYNDRHLTIHCTVRDVSDTGARLKVEGSLSVPDSFELIIEVDGLEASCEVVWRSTNEVGVRFLGAPRKVAAKRVQVVNPLVPPSGPSLRRKPKPVGPPGPEKSRSALPVHQIRNPRRFTISFVHRSRCRPRGSDCDAEQMDPAPVITTHHPAGFSASPMAVRRLAASVLGLASNPAANLTSAMGLGA